MNSITYIRKQIVEYSITNSRMHTNEHNMINYLYTSKKLYTFT